jgi:hypothetical protein
MERQILLQYWNSGSPVAHTALGVVAGKIKGREGRREVGLLHRHDDFSSPSFKLKKKEFP